MKKKQLRKPSHREPSPIHSTALAKPSRPQASARGDGHSTDAVFSIVGIGASAGGYEAFLQLLKQLPADTGMAFVLVQHLDPHHESKLSELLARSTSLPVEEVRSGTRPRPNHIYVMPPNVNMYLAQGVFRFQVRKPHIPHMPIDYFFRSLAEDHPGRAMGIVLSGTGTDGTLGMQDIKGGGGITMAQDENSSKYYGMPGSAIAEGVVDLVLNPEGIAHELARIARHPYIREEHAWKPDGSRASAGLVPRDKSAPERDEELQAVFSLMNVRTNVDFSHYKHSTLKRRILRRMLLHNINTLPTYLNYLRGHPLEVDSLFNDLLINVTSFFRDPRVYEALKRRIFPKMLKNRPGDSPIRIWVCGCATGEEAYSMAICLMEFFEAAHAHARVQIFATDISEPGLEKARAGIYPENILLDVSPERLRRFFVRTNTTYQVSKTLRDMCVFARQNVIMDPPFSNLDMISCRNVLIYLGQSLQKKIMPVFHYAMKPNGYLLLGSSETIGTAGDLFSIVDKRHKIYLKKLAPQRADMGLLYKRNEGKLSLLRLTDGSLKAEFRPPDLQQFVDRLILSRYSPVAVAINAQMDVLLFRGRTGGYLEHATGSASLNLLKMAREGLVLDLRTTISKALKQNDAVRQENIILQNHTRTRHVAIEVIPFQLNPGGERFLLILFEEQRAEAPPPRALAGPVTPRARQAAEHREVAKLRQELSTNRESLQTIIEEQEATNEELKSANEEIQSSNEELQSINEELETAKEELQSTNEELTTLNEEFHTRNTELSQVNNDLTNLFANVNVAIIMLDTEHAIRRFTPMAERVFGLIPSDIGRRLSDMGRNVNLAGLDGLIQQVMDSLTPMDREFQDREGRWYSLRIRPYRTIENKIEGVVLLLMDIDEHKRALELIMGLIKEPLISLGPDLSVKKANPAFYDFFHVSPTDTEGRFLYEIGNGQWNVPKLRVLLEDILTKQQPVTDYEFKAEFPGLGQRTMRLDARGYSEDGRMKKLILLAIKDVPL